MITEHPGPAAAAVTYRQLFRTRGATPLFGLVLATVLGTSLQMFALSVLVYRQTDSALWSSLAFAAGFLPQLVGGAFLTSLADRWPARPVLVSGSALRAAVAVLLAAAHLPPPLAIGLIACSAIWQPLPSAVRSALVARLLTGDLYVLGRSVFTVISSGAQLLGLALGGTVIAVLGPSATFGVAAAIQVAGLLAVFAVPATGVPAAAATRWHPGETLQGSLDLLRDRPIRHILISWWVPVTLLVGAEALVVPYVAEAGGSPATTGLLLAAFPAGAAVGDVIVGRWLSPELRRRSVPWLFALLGIALLPLAWQPSPLVATGCFALASASSAYQLGSQLAFLDAVPAERLGLAFGLYSTGLMSGQGLGPVLAGALAQLAGAGTTITVLGACVLAAATVLARLPGPGTLRAGQVLAEGRPAEQ